MWEQIRRNRRVSLWLVGGLGVLLAAAGAALGGLLAGHEGGLLLGAAAALLLWLLQWAVAVHSGDSILLSIAGAKKLGRGQHPQLQNVVEEMAIAANLPRTPKVYLVDDPVPNAFAVGRSARHAAVAVTTGLLRLLDRDELQGVIGHEIGHVRNRDVALMTTAGIMLGTIVLLGEVAARSLRYGGLRHGRSGRNDRGGGVLLVAAVFLILAPLLAQLLYFALSRRREFLADASAARFTRYPLGLASALEKIGGHAGSLADTSKVTAPMYIAPPAAAARRRNATSWLSTHPPLAERIRILRSMAGAGYGAYERAYQEVRGGRLIGRRGLAEAVEIPLRAPEPEAAAETPAARARTASDAYLAASAYQAQPCPACRAVLKLPPPLQGRLNACLRCGAALPPPVPL